MDVVVLALVLVAMVWATQLFNKRRKWVAAMDRIPGPPCAPVLGNAWDLMWTYKFNQTQAFEDWTNQYGGVFRLWIGSVPVVVLSKPEDLEILLGSTKHIQKADVYRQLHSWIGEGLLTSTGQKWHTRRRLITPSFHFRILDQFVEVFNRNSDILVRKLMAIKETVNIHDLITLCTLDIICETAMGTKVEAQKNSTSAYVSAVHDAAVSFHQRSMKPWLHSDLAFNVSADGKAYNNALKVMHKYTKEVIASRKRERETRRRASLTQTDKELGLKKRVAFLDQLLETNETLQDYDIQEEVDTFMFEGHDTTAAALSFILYNLAANSHVQETLAEEMKEIFGDSDRPASSQDLQNLKYTERVIKESLRLYPSVPLFARHLNEDLPLTEGVILPAGCNVTISCLQMGRDPKQWPDPEKFDPDRFLPEQTAGRHPYAYVPFSAGPRNCIGQKFAMMEMKSTISKIIRHCKVELPYPGYKPSVQGRVILKANEGVLLKISPR